MLNYFKEKKETFFDLTKMNFLNSSKMHFKIRLEIILSDFAEK